MSYQFRVGRWAMNSDKLEEAFGDMSEQEIEKWLDYARSLPPSVNRDKILNIMYNSK